MQNEGHVILDVLMFSVDHFTHYFKRGYKLSYLHFFQLQTTALFIGIEWATRLLFTPYVLRLLSNEKEGWNETDSLLKFPPVI